MSGALIEETYPSGRVVKNTLDADGRLSNVETKTATGAYQTRANSFNFTAAGAVGSMKLGNNRWESTQFNNRLQPTQIALGTTQNNTDLLKLDYTYGTTNNNGNVQSQTITVPTSGGSAGFTAVQNYTYDSLNRIKDAQETVSGSQTWKQTFVYDRYGNRNFDAVNTTTIAGCPVNQCNPTIDTANNRFNNGQGYSYDLSGNIVSDAEGRTFIYDAENKQKEVKNASNVTVGTYFYDGDGKRIKKVTASEEIVFVYDAGGKLVAEYSSLTPQTTPVTRYLTSDHLGSPRIITDGSGNVLSRRDFAPFGEELYTGTGNRQTGHGYTYGDSTRQKFATYDRDKETDLDYAKARMFGSGFGRFTSPDPLMASAKRAIPQSWNRYTYVLNNPLKYVDPSGMIWGQKDLGNGETGYCYAPGKSLCKGYTKYTGDGILSNPSVNGRELGYAIRLLPGGGTERVVAIDVPGQGQSWLSQKDVVAINAISGGVLCSLSAGLACANSMDKEISGNVNAAADTVQMAFLIKSLIAGGVSLGVIAAAIRKNPDDVAKIAEKVIGKGYALTQCSNCAKDLMAAFKKAGIESKLVMLESSPKSAIMAEKTGKAVGGIGSPHYGVQVGDMIYEMNSTKGIPVSDWTNLYRTRGANGLPVPPIIKDASIPH